jgi:heavy metal sensor kinase
MTWRALFRPFRIRLTLWYMLILATVLVMFSGGLYTALSLALYNSMDEVLDSSAELLFNALETNAQGRLVARPGQASQWNDAKGEHFWRVIAPSGQVIDQLGVAEMGDPPLDLAALERALAGRETIQTISGTGNAMRVFTGPVVRGGQIVGVVQLGFSTDDIRHILSALRFILVVAVPASLALASLGGLFLANRALRPVDRITRTAQSISAHDLSRRLDLDLPDDELGRLAGAFNDMIARLDDAFRQQRRFTADASHELRTPLTVIKGNLSLALNRSRSSDYYRQVLTAVDQEVDQMRRLVERLLTLARADAEGVALNRQRVDLSALLTDLVGQMRPLADAKGLSFTAQIAPDVATIADADALTQAVLNLLDNAIKYTLSSGQVCLVACYTELNSHEMQIIISDSGPGIPAEHLAHIFERFYRVDRARSRELGGAGLGLSIARDLIRAHGGDITVHSISGEGSIFTIHLPLGQATEDTFS